MIFLFSVCLPFCTSCCSALGDVVCQILLPLQLRVDYITTRNTSDESLYILSIIGVGDVPTILCM